MKIILGSQSKSRRGVLEKMGLRFEVMVPDVDEKSIRHEDPEKLTLALANAKADALLGKIKEPAILITSDQVVVCGGKIREKPENEDEAREFLRDYAEHPAETIAAVVAVNTETGERREGLDRAAVKFGRIPESVIEKLIAAGEVFSQAGGFCVEDPAFSDYIERTEGDVDSIMGMPKALTERLIKEVENTG